MNTSILQPTGFIWKGVLLSALGLFYMLAPGITIDIVMVVLGAMTLISGIVLLLFEYRAQGKLPGFTYRVAEGITYLVIGVLFVANPRGSASFLLILLGLVLLGVAVIQFVGARRLPAGHPSRALMITGGVVTGVLGILLFINPFGGAQALVILLGVVMFATGALLLILGGVLRKQPL